MITTQQLRTLWLNFWRQKDHAIIPSASVIPQNDATALFHNSGMHPLVPYLLGERHPKGTRLANVQKCIRTGDIEEVGDATHLTFFEMLGNWSLGDFFKTEQIPWSYQFLTQELGIPLERLAVSVFEGDTNAERDQFSAEIWQKCGISPARIAFLPASENWWEKGATGPCGPDTEMFYWTGESPAPENYQDTWEDPRWVEIWNDVFMQFNKLPSGKLEELPNKNVDTGMGLERTVAILNGKSSVYQTDAFAPILESIADLSGNAAVAQNPLGETPAHASARIMADHLRASVVLLSDGVSPSNVDQGYILRRLIRRAVRHGRQLGIEDAFTPMIGDTVVQTLQDAYPEIAQQRSATLSALEQEENQFRTTLDAGEKQFRKIVQNLRGKMISGSVAFDLYQTYGFPLEMTVELAAEQSLAVDQAAFEQAYQQHQSQSRTAASGKFQGGLSRENLEQETRLHTATHLLLAGLRKVLGDGVHQAGSNITAERLRFDFTYDQKVSAENLSAVEAYVNQAIAANAKTTIEEIPKAQAEADTSIEGSFWDKYPDMVKVYTFTDQNGVVWSRELCGGPHVQSTAELGSFAIRKEESSSRGVRRIKAVLK